MGSRTYETALSFEAKGFGWSYGDKPTFVFTSRDLPRTRDTVIFGLADKVSYSILPILIGDGISSFYKLDRDVLLHLTEVKAYKSGIVGLRYEVRVCRGEPRNAT